MLGQVPVLPWVLIDGKGAERSVINTQWGLNGWRSLVADGREDQRKGKDTALPWPGLELSWAGGGLLLVHSKLPGTSGQWQSEG